MATSQGCKTAVPSEAIDSRYLYWYLVGAAQDLNRRASGTTFLEVSGKVFGETAFRWPSLDAQARIVEILEDHLSRLDAANGDLRASIARSEGLAGAALAIATDFDGERATLAEVSVMAGYGTSEKCTVDGPGAIVVRIPNIVNGEIDLADVKRALNPTVDLSRLMLQAGDIVIVRTNGSRDLIGRASVAPEGIDAAFASYLIRYRPRIEIVRPEWVQAVLASPRVRRLIERAAASSAGQYNLSLAKLDSLPIPLPSREEQTRRLEGFELARDGARRLAKEASTALTRSASLRRALLSAAFAGRLTGKSSDNDVVEELAAREQ